MGRARLLWLSLYLAGSSALWTVSADEQVWRWGYTYLLDLRGSGRWLVPSCARVYPCGSSLTGFASEVPMRRMGSRRH